MFNQTRDFVDADDDVGGSLELGRNDDVHGRRDASSWQRGRQVGLFDVALAHLEHAVLLEARPACYKSEA